MEQNASDIQWRRFILLRNWRQYIHSVSTLLNDNKITEQATSLLCLSDNTDTTRMVSNMAVMLNE